MDTLLRFCRAIDRTNRFVGRAMVWPLLASVAISAGNALSRKFFSISSNGWIEAQWHLFAVAFLGCAVRRVEDIRRGSIDTRPL